jgi:CheY-like chemotaxis protein
MNNTTAKYNILVVDDAPANLRVLVDILMHQYEISVATGGEEALKIAGSPDPPDLVLLDIVMPKMSGYEVCEALRKKENTRDIPVIFVTAHTDDETLQEAFAAGGTDYVRKPVSRVEILARVNAALTQQELTRKLLEEEKLKGVLEMAGAVCHELNQPMQAILGFAQLLLMDMPEEHPNFEYLGIIRNQIGKMGEITRKLMRITKYETIHYLDETRIIDINRAAVDYDPSDNDGSV